MKKFHIAFYINKEEKILTGITICSNDICSALDKFLSDKSVSDYSIKYVMEL